MEGLPVRRLIDTCRRIVDAAAKVLYVPQDMTLSVLRHRPTEISTYTEEGGCGLLHGIARNRKAANNNEPSTP
jgi:hypothetical protein